MFNFVDVSGGCVKLVFGFWILDLLEGKSIPYLSPSFSYTTILKSKIERLHFLFRLFSLGCVWILVLLREKGNRNGKARRGTGEGNGKVRGFNCL